MLIKVSGKTHDLNRGMKAKCETTWGVSDANIFNDKGWMQCINLGYGAEMTHTTMEQIRLSEMEKLRRVMLKLVE
jgi:di/tripeptidase